MTARRHQLDGPHEPAVHQLLRERRLLFALDRRARVRLARYRPLRFGDTTMPRQSRTHRLGRQGNLPDMLRRRPATAPNQAHTGGNEAPRVRRHIFRGTEIEIAALDVARLTRIRLRREPYIYDVGDALDSFKHRR